MTEREMVEQFHTAMGLPVRTTPTMPSEAERVMRCRLLLEETLEYIRASGCVVKFLGDGRMTAVSMPEAGTPDLAAMAQECADVLYVANGSMLTMGVPSEVFAEVHRANMSKLGDDGEPVLREDGKVMKGPNYRPPDVSGVLARAVDGAWCTACRRAMQDGAYGEECSGCGRSDDRCNCTPLDPEAR